MVVRIQECGGADGTGRVAFVFFSAQEEEEGPSSPLYSVLQELGWSVIKHNCNLIVFWVYMYS